MKVVFTPADLIDFATKAVLAVSPQENLPPGATTRPLWERGGKHPKFLGVEITFPHVADSSMPPTEHGTPDRR